MDELELLKKDWDKSNDRYPKLTYKEIYKMLQAKSSSIVKWIFIISLLEFAFWTGIGFLLKDYKTLENVEDIERILLPISIVSYAVLIYFFYLFYRNYRRITSTDSTKNLMKTILKTRQTVKYYVGFNLISLVIGVFWGSFYALNHDPSTVELINTASANGEILKYYVGIIIVIIFALTITIGFLLLFYWLVYGILLKRLNRNYRELKKLEV